LQSQGKEKDKGKKGKKGKSGGSQGSEPRVKKPPPQKKKEDQPEGEGMYSEHNLFRCFGAEAVSHCDPAPPTFMFIMNVNLKFTCVEIFQFLRSHPQFRLSESRKNAVTQFIPFAHFFTFLSCYI
jgi:hypothetical protein